MAGKVATFGDLPGGVELLAREAWRHGWSMVAAPTAKDLQDLNETSNIVAVLLSPGTDRSSWEKALAEVHEAAPGALPVICWRFGSVLPWGEMAGAGAFHYLHYPFHVGEVRQAFGFVWGAKHPRRTAAPSRSDAPVAAKTASVA